MPHAAVAHVNHLLLILSIHTLFLLCCFSIDEQGEALLSWKNSLNISIKDHQYQHPLRTWNPLDSSPCHHWLGVSCNSNGQVTQISLKSLDLQGSLPSNFRSLQSLNTLIISATNLSGSIPKEFGEYQQLSFLDLSSNAISGEIPNEICRLSKLQTLSLSSNLLQGGIPSDIGNLSNLLHLTLYDNQLSGEIPKSIGNLSKLQIFRAGGNQNLKGELPWEIGNCSSLVMLGLAETSISGSLPESIGSLQKIQTIAIYTSLLSGPIPEEIGNCSELRNLYLYQNSISGSIPRRIGQLQKLESLLLWQNSLVGTIPYELGSCKQLTVIDLSENSLSGSIPTSFGNLLGLQELQLSVNQLSGFIPSEILNCTALTHLEVDNNGISGEIPESIGRRLKSLTLLFAWQNKLTGHIPESLSECQNLQALDLSYNHLSGPIPKQIFGLTNLTKLLLLSNDLSGLIPPDIGNCTNLYRFRLNDNKLAGVIPAEIGNLKNLNFLDMSSNKFAGEIPPSLFQCQNLQFLDLHSNGLTGSMPGMLPKSLQLLDVADNRLTGSLPPSLGSLTELTKLNLGKNQFSGKIPSELSSCTKLQLLDVGDNGFSGNIPKELGQIPGLGISLNLSRNQFTGEIPFQFIGLDKLGILDISYNQLVGSVNMLASLQNLVVLNISFNDFSGELPNTPFFRKLPLSALTGNQALHIPSGFAMGPGVGVGIDARAQVHRKSTLKLAMSLLISASVLLLVFAVYMLVRSHVGMKAHINDNRWEMTLYQKLNFSIDDVVHQLTSSNVIGTGSSGVVYRVPIPNGLSIAVKKMWSSEESGAFESEIKTLGSIRHKNIVRLLGWCANQNMKLLIYDYLSNGSLSALLHGGCGKRAADWEMRYDAVLGVGHALAYLHHDCVPAIIHGDVKAMNVLLGPMFEPYLADFGLARLVVKGEHEQAQAGGNRKPQLAGSYGYMAPEHASPRGITEKSDVYSFGVVLLEVLTGRHPLDPTLPGGAHLVQWAREHLQLKNKDPLDIIDSRLQGRPDSQTHEMLQTLAVSFLCISTRADERPIMKDVVAMLKEIRPMAASSLDHNKQDYLCSSKVVGSNSSITPVQPVSSSTKTVQSMVLQAGSSNCSFAFSDEDDSTN